MIKFSIIKQSLIVNINCTNSKSVYRMDDWARLVGYVSTTNDVTNLPPPFINLFECVHILLLQAFRKLPSATFPSSFFQAFFYYLGCRTALLSS